MMGRLCYLLLLLVSGGVCLFWGSRWLLVLVLALVLLPLGSVLLQLIRRRGLRLELSAPSDLERDARGSVVLTLHNPGILPVGHGVCRLRMTNLLTGGQEQLAVPVFAPGRGSHSVSLDFSSRHCGRVALQSEKLYLYDPFGVAGVSCGVSAAAQITVQPACFPQTILISADANCPDDSEVYSAEKPGYDLSEVWQLREYQPGDSPRQIHWKLSGKLDRLVVRDPSLPVRRSVLVFWERTQTATPEETDAQADAVISVCQTLLEDGLSFTVAWNDGESGGCVLQELRSLDDLAALLPRLLAAGETEGASGAELLLRSCGEAVISHILYITGPVAREALQLGQLGRLTVLSCRPETEAQGALIFDPEHYREQLAELEL